MKQISSTFHSKIFSGNNISELVGVIQGAKGDVAPKNIWGFAPSLRFSFITVKRHCINPGSLDFRRNNTSELPTLFSPFAELQNSIQRVWHPPQKESSSQGNCIPLQRNRDIKEVQFTVHSPPELFLGAQESVVISKNFNKGALGTTTPAFRAWPSYNRAHIS